VTNVQRIGASSNIQVGHDFEWLAVSVAEICHRGMETVCRARDLCHNR
jgi:hypothetical protein